MPIRKYCYKKSAIIIGAFFSSIILLYLFRGSILTGMGRFLVVNDALKSADIIFVLIGGESTRPFHAADLYKQGFAPEIVIPQSELPARVQFGDCATPVQVYTMILHNIGIPNLIIQTADFPKGVSSTQEEAEALKEYVNQHSINSAIIVTDGFHTRRAKYIFEKELRDESIIIMMSPAPHWKFDETNWWRHEEGLVFFINEYLKFIHYLLS